MESIKKKKQLSNSIVLSLLIGGLISPMSEAQLPVKQTIPRSFQQCSAGDAPRSELDHFCPRLEGVHLEGCCPPLFKEPPLQCRYAVYLARGQIYLGQTSYQSCENGQTVSKACCRIMQRGCYDQEVILPFKPRLLHRNSRYRQSQRPLQVCRLRPCPLRPCLLRRRQLLDQSRHQLLHQSPPPLHPSQHPAPRQVLIQWGLKLKLFQAHDCRSCWRLILFDTFITKRALRNVWSILGSCGIFMPCQEVLTYLHLYQQMKSIKCARCADWRPDFWST